MVRTLLPGSLLASLALLSMMVAQLLCNEDVVWSGKANVAFGCDMVQLNVNAFGDVSFAMRARFCTLVWLLFPIQTTCAAAVMAEWYFGWTWTHDF